MRLGYFIMPLHPESGPWPVTLEEDRHGILLADKLGFHDAFVGEHLADGCETITSFPYDLDPARSMQAAAR